MQADGQELAKITERDVIRFSPRDAAEVGLGWYAVRRDVNASLPEVSQLFATADEARAWARRKGDIVREVRHA